MKIKLVFFIIIFSISLSISSSYANNDKEDLAKKRVEFFERERNIDLEYNNRNSDIIKKSSECKADAKTKREFNLCKNREKEDLAHLNKEFKLRKKALRDEKKFTEEAYKNKRKIRK